MKTVESESVSSGSVLEPAGSPAGGPRMVAVAVAGLVGGFAGFYLGLIVLLSLTGLGQAQWAPPANLSGVGLVAAIAAGLVGGLGAIRCLVLAAIAAAVGAATGLALAFVDGDFEVVIGTAVLLVAGVIVGVRRMAITST